MVNRREMSRRLASGRRSGALHVAAALESGSGFTNMLLRGLGRWLAENPGQGVDVTHIDVGRRAPDLSRFDALIYHAGHPHFDQAAKQFAGPTLNVTRRPDQFISNSVVTDDTAAVRLAAEHFHEYGRTHVAVVTNRHAVFHRLRTAAFARAAKDLGITTSLFELPTQPSTAMLARLASQLQALGTPIGVFATDDVLGQHVCRLLDVADVKVPEDVGVLAMGNDVNICEFTRPPLSSVDNAIDQRGYEAIRLAVGQCRGQPPLSEPMMIQPRSVIIRRSSDIHAVAEPNVRLALSFIHENAGESLNVEDVVEFVQISRRSLEQKFAHHLQRTVHEEIWRAHMKLARQLLIDTNLPVFQVASRSGFGTLSNFCTIFRRRQGTTPNAYRQQHRGVVGYER